MKQLFVISLIFMMRVANAARVEYYNDIPNACGDFDNLWAIITPISYTCDVGEFLPANTLGCRTCPAGYTCNGGTYDFNDINAQGLTRNASPISQNANNLCSRNVPHKLQLVYTPISYTCNAGYFLPADTLGCRACPAGYTCAGGTYTFNETRSQGLVANSNIQSQNETNTCAKNRSHILTAVYTRDEYDCAPGYYVPADTEGCVICPNNSYCVGGIYYYDANTDQGITACAAGTFAPEGMWEVAQCGRIFHVGDDVIYLRSVRKTVHALNFDMDMDGVADYFANMTPLSVPMHINSEHGLKILLDGIEYSVYDDTVDLGLYENNPFVPAQ